MSRLSASLTRCLSTTFTLVAPLTAFFSLFLLASLFIFTAMPTAIASTATETVADNIIGGEETQPGAYPWMVGLIENGKDDIFWAQYCGGTLVHPEWVLTAAHCTYDFGRAMVPSDLDILVGQDKLRATTGQRIAVEQIIRHPGSNRKTGDTDLALLKLAQPTTHPTVTMADASMVDVAETGAVGTVLGWGRTSTNIRVNHLHQANVPLVASATCTNAYSALGYTMTDNMLCAGFQQGGHDACSGDSGGPLVIREVEGDEASAWVQVGIVSWGRGCAQANAYGVYTHIARFKNWVDVQIALNSFANDAGTIVMPPAGQSTKPSQIFMPIINH